MYCGGLGCFAVLASLLISSAALPEKQTERNSILQKLLSRRDSGAQDPAASQTRIERRPHLSEDDREIMTKQLMHAISEMMNSECMSDRDYKGWVDFGRRRDAEMA
uniref:Gastrin/cholecystokinin peptide hormone domain-containing protein n=1 Tax=Neogobius melanostomus TaxID=47308 RepID=A0A8C6TQ79_9GOBI